MKNLDQLKSTIEEIITLLESVEETEYVQLFIHFRQQCENSNERDLLQLRTDIKKIYGGMGSFNDLFLCKNNKLLNWENGNLNNLRSKLFKLLNDR